MMPQAFTLTIVEDINMSFHCAPPSLELNGGQCKIHRTFANWAEYTLKWWRHRQKKCLCCDEIRSAIAALLWYLLWCCWHFYHFPPDVLINNREGKYELSQSELMAFSLRQFIRVNQPFLSLFPLPFRAAGALLALRDKFEARVIN